MLSSDGELSKKQQTVKLRKRKGFQMETPFFYAWKLSMRKVKKKRLSTDFAA